MKEFDRSKDQILKRGIIDPYDLHDDPNRWVVLQEYVFWSARLQQEIIIPRWFHTDLASIPQAMRWLISVNERHRLAALVHDFGYALGGYSNQPRHVWDELFFDFAKLFGVTKWKTYALFYAVHLFGDTAWRKPKEMFIPMKHRAWYHAQFPELDLPMVPSNYNII